MKITLVTEHKIIIGTLQSSTSQSVAEDGWAVQSAVNITAPVDALTGRAQEHGVPETPLEPATAAEYATAIQKLGAPSTTHLSLGHTTAPVHACHDGCAPGSHHCDPLQASDTPLGTPPDPRQVLVDIGGKVQVATGPLPYHDDYCICDECMAAIAAANAAAQSGEPAALSQTLSPCAEGDTLSLVIIIGNVVKRNG